MGYWINPDSTRNTAHRDDIPTFIGIYQNCKPQNDWEHINLPPGTTLRGISLIPVRGRQKRVKPCENCEPWPM